MDVVQLLDRLKRTTTLVVVSHDLRCASARLPSSADVFSRGLLTSLLTGRFSSIETRRISTLLSPASGFIEFSQDVKDILQGYRGKLMNA